mmetsp:Transcript_44858/g.78300  ORF Transcript_44858/g.78300 Transcript_44858/m.78300 type:complete len:214 (+) Transcript_44858:690-1331(+)
MCDMSWSSMCWASLWDIPVLMLLSLLLLIDNVMCATMLPRLRRAPAAAFRFAPVASTAGTAVLVPEVPVPLPLWWWADRLGSTASLWVSCLARLDAKLASSLQRVANIDANSERTSCSGRASQVRYWGMHSFATVKTIDLLEGLSPSVEFPSEPASNEAHNCSREQVIDDTLRNKCALIVSVTRAALSLPAVDAVPTLTLSALLLFVLFSFVW